MGELVIALSSQTGAEAVTFWRTGLTPGAPLTYAGRIGLTFPAGAEHTTYALAARQAPDAHSDVEVYFNIGAAANSVATPPTSTVALTGSGLTFTPAAVVADSIHRLRVSDSEAGLAVSTPQQIARGLRNAAGMTFDAGGDLYLQDNGIDTEGNRGVSFSADELNRIPAATLGQTVLDFRWSPSCRWPAAAARGPWKSRWRRRASVKSLRAECSPRFSGWAVRPARRTRRIRSYSPIPPRGNTTIL